MPRRARLMLPNVAVHIIQRGNNRQACFFQKADYLNYLQWLTDYAETSECSIHAYCLMTNHVHLLLTAGNAEGPGEMMKRLGQRYVQYINRRYHRSGTLWEGRYRSCLAREESYVLACYRYIELNPTRAGLVKHPAEYRWSSYRANAQGERSSLIKAHDHYIALGLNEISRQNCYRELFRCQLEQGMIDEIRQSTNGNYTLGSSRFAREIEMKLGRRTVRGKAGRPFNNRR